MAGAGAGVDPGEGPAATSGGAAPPLARRRRCRWAVAAPHGDPSGSTAANCWLIWSRGPRRTVELEFRGHMPCYPLPAVSSVYRAPRRSILWSYTWFEQIASFLFSEVRIFKENCEKNRQYFMRYAALYPSRGSGCRSLAMMCSRFGAAGVKGIQRGKAPGSHATSPPITDLIVHGSGFLFWPSRRPHDMEPAPALIDS